MENTRVVPAKRTVNGQRANPGRTYQNRVRKSRYRKQREKEQRDNSPNTPQAQLKNPFQMNKPMSQTSNNPYQSSEAKKAVPDDFNHDSDHQRRDHQSQHKKTSSNRSQTLSASTSRSVPRLGSPGKHNGTGNDTFVNHPRHSNPGRTHPKRVRKSRYRQQKDREQREKEQRDNFPNTPQAQLQNTLPMNQPVKEEILEEGVKRLANIVKEEMADS